MTERVLIVLAFLIIFSTMVIYAWAPLLGLDRQVFHDAGLYLLKLAAAWVVTFIVLPLGR